MTHDAKPYSAEDCCAIERGDMFLTLDRVTDTVKALAAKQAEVDKALGAGMETALLMGVRNAALHTDLARAVELLRETLERAKREQEPQKPPVGVAWMREQLKRIFFRWAGADSGSPEMHNRDVEIDGLLLDHWTAPVFRVQASQQPQQDDVSAAREVQASRVMPLIGPLLDAWDGLGNDQRNYTNGFQRHMALLAAEMGADEGMLRL